MKGRGSARANYLAPHPLTDREAIDWELHNPLKRYMNKTDRTPDEMARRMGCRRQSIWKWLRGALPELHAAYELERVTNGAVPVEAWLVHPRAVEAIDRWRKNRDE